jgi:alpha-ketoglutarate-dependent 2,4-dichlorophenoxyacetate dioxygenase
MTLTFTPLHPSIGAQVSAVDLSRLDDRTLLEQIRDGMDRFAVLVFRDQSFVGDEQLEFAQRFDGQIHRKTGSRAIKKNRFGDEGLTDISNVDSDNALLEKQDRARLYSLGNRLWHTDASFEDPAGRYSMLYAKVIPDVRADTEFADTRTAYDSLDDEAKAQLEGLTVHHTIAHSRRTLGFDFSEEEEKLIPGAIHPLVREFPRTGRRSLYIASHAAKILQMPVPDGRLLLHDLMAHATRPELVMRHSWHKGDLVIWDNRASMHRATPFDDQAHRRELVRVTTLDIAA